MTTPTPELRQQIDALTDAQAVRLVQRLATTLRSQPPAPAELTARLQQARHELPEADAAPGAPPQAPTPGDLARRLLRWVLHDPWVATLLLAELDAVRTSAGAEAEAEPTEAAPELATADVLTLFDTVRTPAPATAGAPVIKTRGLPMANGGGVERAVAAAPERQSLLQDVLAHAGLQPGRGTVDVEYPVWFATTRQPLDAAHQERGYGPERDPAGTVHHGVCKVFVPRSHTVGSLGSSWWKRLLTFTDDRLVLRTITEQAESAYWAGLAAQLASVEADERDAVVLIHGYNVTFEEAALRAAQLGFDLQVRGAMAFYSWASRGDTEKYTMDEATVDLDEQPLADFLCDLVQRSGARRVHLIAHSMGNRALIRAVDRIARDAQRRSGVRFGQIILAAPDIDARLFAQLCQAYTQMAERTTLYASPRDRALGASEWLHGYARAGLLPPVQIESGIDTVNVSSTDLTVLGHGYVAEARSVVADIHALIRGNVPPAERFGLQHVSDDRGRGYWMIAS